MLLAEMSWMDVEEYLKGDTRVVVTTGACEQHGYLSLLSDILIPMEIAQSACRGEQVCIAPPLPYGISPYFEAYPGTISLSIETFVGVVREVLKALIAQGFRGILVNNGHGGNSNALFTLLVELSNAHPEVKFGLFDWFQHPDVLKASEATGLPVTHANWTENFRFTRLGDVPEEVKEEVDFNFVSPAAQIRSILGDGSFGGPYQVPDDVNDQILEVAVSAMVNALRELM